MLHYVCYTKVQHFYNYYYISYNGCSQQSLKATN